MTEPINRTTDDRHPTLSEVHRTNTMLGTDLGGLILARGAVVSDWLNPEVARGPAIDWRYDIRQRDGSVLRGLRMEQVRSVSCAPMDILIQPDRL